MTGGSFVFLHPAVKDSELSCDFSPHVEYLSLDITLSKEQRSSRLNALVIKKFLDGFKQLVRRNPNC